MLRRLPLLLAPAVLVVSLLRFPPEIVFAWALIAWMPLANTMSQATNALALHHEPKIGGLLDVGRSRAAVLFYECSPLSS